ncbi:tripartite tricarboxylate transporter substrate binding protein [Pollutimonas sp. H1-120]|uniref:Bug family tripartite tricarboxylate transporter substrate binding protein n=1 Tax=Pollutimonas sp. H1-120 TaxID=3148824 RepID=UPI003B51E0A0
MKCNTEFQRRRMINVAILSIATLAATLFQSNHARAAYPDKPISLVVGFAAGGPTDVLARVLAAEIGKDLDQSVVVENKPGAGSNLAARYVARANPDGYTLLMVAVTSAINQTLYSNPGFNLATDFKPVALGAKVPSVLVVNPELPVKTVQELVDYAKANPGKLNFGSSGNGTSIHVAGEMFKSEAGIDVMHIPYRGSAPAATALVGGQISFMFDNVPSIWPFVESGRLRALAVTTAERIDRSPDLPTMAESGFPTFDVSSWYGLAAPANTPDEIVKRLNESVQRVLSKPDVQEQLKRLGVMYEKTTPQSFGQFIQDEVARWAPIVRASGARVD